MNRLNAMTDSEQKEQSNYFDYVEILGRNSCSAEVLFQ
jgi:hypothetical protein